MAGTALFAATTKGWLCISLETGTTVCRGRKGWLVSTIAVANRHVLVACPELAEAHSMMTWWDGKDGQVKKTCLVAENRCFCVVHVESGTLPTQRIAWALLIPVFPAGERRMACEAG